MVLDEGLICSLLLTTISVSVAEQRKKAVENHASSLSPVSTLKLMRADAGSDQVDRAPAFVSRLDRPVETQAIRENSIF